MTEKEFHKLRRHDILQLLVTQVKENGRLQEELDEANAELLRLQGNNEHLKGKLNEKDALIEKLKGRLDQKDAKIRSLREEMEEWRSSRRIELDEAGSIAEAALRLNGIFEVAQQAADQYLYNIRKEWNEPGKDSIRAEEPGEACRGGEESEEMIQEDSHGNEEG